MQLVPAGVPAELDRYIGYWEPYATSHEALDKDQAVQEEVRNAARTLASRRSGAARGTAGESRKRAGIAEAEMSLNFAAPAGDN